MKCQLDSGYYLELSMRSSSPLKYLLVMANGVGIIEIIIIIQITKEKFSSRFLIFLHSQLKSRRAKLLGQGIIKRYHLAESNTSTNKRKGGFGSTDK